MAPCAKLTSSFVTQPWRPPVSELCGSHPYPCNYPSSMLTFLSWLLFLNHSTLSLALPLVIPHFLFGNSHCQCHFCHSKSCSLLLIIISLTSLAALYATVISISCVTVRLAFLQPTYVIRWGLSKPAKDKKSRLTLQRVTLCPPWPAPAYLFVKDFLIYIDFSLYIALSKLCDTPCSPHPFLLLFLVLLVLLWEIHSPPSSRTQLLRNTAVWLNGQTLELNSKLFTDKLFNFSMQWFFFMDK